MSDADAGPDPSEYDPLEGLEADDFAGHSIFRQLTVEQKLLWLAHAASFVLEARRVREERTRSE